MRHDVSPPYETSPTQSRKIYGRVHQPRLRPMPEAGRPAHVQRSGNTAGLTIAVALVTIALAAVVGAAFTAWHYWNVENRAAVMESKREQRGLELWKQAARNAESRRQEIRDLDEARLKIASQSRPLPGQLEEDQGFAATLVRANTSPYEHR